VSRIEWSAALLVPLLWGIQFVAIKLGLSAFPPLFMAAMSFFLIALLLLPFVGVGSAKDIRGAAFISLSFGGLGFGLFFCGLFSIPSSYSQTLQVANLLLPNLAAHGKF
jgi:O-acetylserine/cysteine efflux transporter